MSDTLSFINLTDATLVSEEDLLDRARGGDRSAFGTLYLRHRDAARKVAGMCTNSAADAEDAVAEGFARVFAALPRMVGRTIAFRPYLLTCVRNAATDRLRRERRIDLRETLPETPAMLQADDVALLGLERNLVGEALQALPVRWRTVLWLTEVEGLSPAEVSRRIGIKPNAVAALAYRARKGLREAYLQAHLRAEASEECRATVSRLGNYVRADLAEKERLAVQGHLDLCAKCRCRRDELTDVNATLRSAFLPVPLLFAGAQRRLLGLGNVVSQWMDRAPDLSHAAPLVDHPLLHKALAGVSMLVLALSGAAAPKLLADLPGSEGSEAATAVASLPGSLSVLVTSPAAADPTQERSGSGVLSSIEPSATATSAVAVPESAPAPTDDPEGVAGATQSRLLPNRGGRHPSDGHGGPGETEGPVSHLLAGTPVAPLLGGALGIVDEALGVLGVGASVPEPLVSLSVGSPEATTTAPPATAPVAETAGDLVSDVVGGLLEPVSDVLNVLD